jgi:uncharacterized surface protein with fasciclin (FAS1) repeats
MKIQIKSLSVLLLLAIAVSFSSCENDQWNEHYRVDPSIVPDENVWEIIKENPQFSIFAWAVRKTGFEKALTSSQMYTLWIPDNNALNNLDTTAVTLDDEALIKEYLQNHISNFSYPASGQKLSSILFLNKKKMDFGYKNNGYYIGDIRVKQPNILASNGIIHVIDQRIPFFSNIWEYMSRTSELDSIRNYFYSFNRLFFDEQNSIPGDVNDEGLTVYLDSVIYNYNVLFRRLGDISNEDSTYTAMLPTNTAWKTSYNKISKFYKYYAQSPAVQITADTLQRSRTLLALTKDLFFSHTIQSMNEDSLQSTSRSKFYRPFAELGDGIPASNGFVYVTQDIPYRAWESWHKEIRVEAERSAGRSSTWSDIYDRTYQGIEFDVSNRRYIEVVPAIASINPSVTFDIPNTLSGKKNADGTITEGGAYDIYVRFMPHKLRSTSPRQGKVVFSLIYQSDDRGRIVTVNYNNDPDNFVLSPDTISKVLVASNVVFPYSEFGLETPNVKLRVSARVTAAQTTQFTRDMLIDCIIFEPVQ